MSYDVIIANGAVISADGQEQLSPWQDGKPWSQILDVTTPAAERPKAPAKPDEGEKE